MSLGVYLLNSKQAFIVYEVKIKSHSIYRAEIWEQIVYIGYCDVNTTRESIKRQTNKKEMCCIRPLSTNILSIVLKYLVCLPGGWEAS